MPLGNLETAPKRKRVPKGLVTRWRVDELSVAVGQINERPALALKAEDETVDKPNETETGAEISNVETATPAAKAMDPEEMASMLMAMKEQLDGLGEGIAKLSETVSQLLSHETTEGAENAEMDSSVEMARADAAGGEATMVVKKAVGVPGDMLHSITQALAPHLRTTKRIHVSFQFAEPREVKAPEAPAAAVPAAKADAGDIASQLAALQARVAEQDRLLENVRAGTKAAPSDGIPPAPAAPEPQPSQQRGGMWGDLLNVEEQRARKQNA